VTDRQREETERYRDEANQLVQYCRLGDPDDVQVNGQRFAFEAARVCRVYASRDDEYPTSLTAEWANVQWINGEDEEVAITIPACFLDSAPMVLSSKGWQPAAISWACEMERVLIDMAEKKGGWY